MNPLFLVTSAVFCLTIFLLQESEAHPENHELKDLKNKATCKENLFALDGSYGNAYGKRKMRSKKILDCFGLGSKFARILDYFLKSPANGTSSNTQITKFYATSRNMPKRVTLSHLKAFNLTDVDFDITRRTVLIVHGFFATGDEKWIEDMNNALLKWNDVNVFIVDWSDGSDTWNYYKAAINTQTVGDQIATFFGQLVDAVMLSNEVDVNPDSFGTLHFIGHSLGAHICGYAAKEMKKRENKWRVQRITGLDPAQPCFVNSDSSLRLDQNDAPFVDVIHTNGRVLAKLGLGMPYPIGHVDFYPNGGKFQPGCGLVSSSWWNYLPLPIQTIAKTICSHGRSYLYFIDSIMCAVKRGCRFWAHEWDLTYERVDALLEVDCKDTKCIEMGIDAEKYHLNGTFLTITGKSQPYCYIDTKAKEEVKEIILKTRRKLLCETEVEPKDKREPKDEVLIIYD